MLYAVIQTANDSITRDNEYLKTYYQLVVRMTGTITFNLDNCFIFSNLIL